MAVKTITIDMEAYEALRRHKGPGDSFSDVIKDHFAGRTTGRALARMIATLGVAESTLDQVDQIIAGRARDEARPPAL